MKTVVFDAGEMRAFAAEYIAALAPVDTSVATTIALSGELGAGKTTFAQAIAKVLGVTETVNSPTFVLQKAYALKNQKWGRLVHIDAYRLKSAGELRHLGWDELIADPRNLILIEWPERVEGAIPERAHRLSIEVGDGDERFIHFNEHYVKTSG